MRKHTLVAADTHEDILCRSFQRTTLAGTHWRARAARCVLLAGARIVASGESPSARFSCCTHCRCCHPRCRCWWWCCATSAAALAAPTAVPAAAATVKWKEGRLAGNVGDPGERAQWVKKPAELAT